MLSQFITWGLHSTKWCTQQPNMSNAFCMYNIAGCRYECNPIYTTSISIDSASAMTLWLIVMAPAPIPDSAVNWPQSTPRQNYKHVNLVVKHLYQIRYCIHTSALSFLPPFCRLSPSHLSRGWALSVSTFEILPMWTSESIDSHGKSWGTQTRITQVYSTDQFQS